jgi:hypothetical protein
MKLGFGTLLPVLVASLASNPAAPMSQKIVAGETPPASVSRDAMIILDEVVTEQWPVTLPLVNAPYDMTLLNPGQCIRAAAVATGDGNEHIFDQASLSLAVKMSGKEDTFPLSPITLTKRIKPEGSDFVLGALHAGGVKDDQTANFMAKAAASMAVSNDKWCVPLGAPDGEIEVRVAVKRGDQQTVLNTRTIKIESLASAAKRTFKDDKEFSDFMQTYHQSPEPGRLLPALQYATAGEPKSMIPFYFFRAAFKEDAATAQGFGPELAASAKPAKMFGLILMDKAGVALVEPPTLSDDEKKTLAETPDLPDAYDSKPIEQLGAKQDFLWAEFSATGHLQPLRALVNELAWRSDFDAFDAMRKSGKKPDKLTDSIMRGVCYTAAGWSLGSFQRSDPLAADYLDAISANPSTPANIKDELAHLSTNPAFKQ